MPDLPDDRRGPGVFGYLAKEESEWLAEPERDRLATAVSAALSRLDGYEVAGAARTPPAGCPAISSALSRLG